MEVDTTHRDNLKMIFNHYGYEAQSQQLIQELAELIVAITKKDTLNFIEELADVLVMIGQFLTVYPDLEDSVIAIQKEKIKRQLDRINKEIL